MTDKIKDMILNPEENPPERAEMDFSGMSDEEFMKLNTEDIFFEDMDRFLAEKERRLSKSPDVEESISEEAASATADDLSEKTDHPENSAVSAKESVNTAGEAEASEGSSAEEERPEGSSAEEERPEGSSAETEQSAEGPDQAEQPDDSSGETTTGEGSSVEAMQAESAGDAASSEETPAGAVQTEEM